MLKSKRNPNLTRRPVSDTVTALALALMSAVAVSNAHAQTPSADNTGFSASDGTSTSIVQRARDAGHRALEKTTALTEYALGFLGIQYKFGGASPENGFDCSGLVRFVFQQVTGLSLPHSAVAQSKEGQEVAMEDLRPGDLVFFNTRKFAFSHVGIYLGDNKFVHAPRKGKPVQVVEFDNPYWQKAYNGARRMMESAPKVFGGSVIAGTLPGGIPVEPLAAGAEPAKP